MIENRSVSVCTCERCGKEFVPLRCPECRNTSWNKDAPRRGRPRKEIAPPAYLDEQESPIESQSPAEVQVISTRHMPPEHTPAPARKQSKAKQSAGNRQKIGEALRCQHNMMVLPDGTTQCPKCIASRRAPA